MGSSELVAAVVGALVGSISTLLWEAFIKPKQEERSLAEMLAAELSLNLQILGGEIAQFRQNPRTVPMRSPMQVQIYEATLSRLGQVPLPLINKVVHTYRLLYRINWSAERANLVIEALGQLPDEDPEPTFLRTRLEDEIAIYSRFSEEAARKLNELLPNLYKHASPWWSPRFWRAPEPKTLDFRDMKGRVEENTKEHQERVSLLRKPSL